MALVLILYLIIIEKIEEMFRPSGSETITEKQTHNPFRVNSKSKSLTSVRQLVN